MLGQNMWGWQQHQAEEFHLPMQLCNENNKIVFQQKLTLPQQIHQQSWGRIPFIYSMGDQN